MSRLHRSIRAAARRWAALLLAFGVLVAASGAQAEWLKVSTDDFNVYGPVAEPDIARMASDLQRFHNALEKVLSVNQGVTRKLDVYMVPKAVGLKTVLPSIGENVIAFYSMPDTGPIAVVVWDQSAQLEVRQRLFHEYAHHFMSQNMPQSLPAWFNEGFAEFLSTAEFSGDNVNIGLAPEDRFRSLTTYTWFPTAGLLTFRPTDTRPRDVDMMYAQGWLLTQYLMIDKDRSTQLYNFLTALGEGKAPEAAFSGAFGVATTGMDQRLQAYLRNGLRFLRVPLPDIPESALTVTSLDPSADKTMYLALHMMLEGASSADNAAARLAEVREAADGGPDGAFGRQTLARAEQMFGDPARAIAILDKMPNGARDPFNLHIYGMASLKLAQKADGEAKQTLLKQASAAFAQAFRVDATYFPALFQYALLQDRQSETFINAMVQSLKLAPQMPDLRASVSSALMTRGDYDSAVHLLEPLANSPHATFMAMVGQVLLEAARDHKPPPRDVNAQANARMQALAARN